MPWWGWLFVGVAVLAFAAFIVRVRLRYLVKVVRALCTDERLPRPLRWGLKLALAIKVVPLPDIGVNEVILVAIGLLLLTVYRPTLRAILDELRAAPPPLPDIQ